MNFYNKLNINSAFPVCYNLLPHYAAAGRSPGLLKKCVDDALTDGRIRTFFLSDNPGQAQEVSPLQLAGEIVASGGEPIISLALTYDDRYTVIEKIKRYCRVGVTHFLFVSGEYPNTSVNKTSGPLYDLDCVQLLMLLKKTGLSADRQKFPSSPDTDDKELNLVRGCVVSPFKTLESEQVWQYEKLKRKVAVGADFVITQLGYDIRKFDELLRFCRLQNISAPLVANIFVTDLQAANMFRQGKVSGVFMPDKMLQDIEREAADPLQAENKMISRSAMTLSVLRGLGYNGALLGDNSMNFSTIRKVLDEAEGMQADWKNFLKSVDYSSDSSFYYFQKDYQHGLNTDEPSPVSKKHALSLLYTFSYFVDSMVYLPKGPFFKLTGQFCCFCNGKKYWYRFLWLQEFLSKGLLYGCTMCGDCVLYSCGFLCYQAGCPKKMVNGPCGGSVNGFCEVFPGKKKCYWVKVYKQLKGVARHVTFTAPPIPARDNSLNRTSSWINFFLGRDHRKMHFEKD